MKREDLEDLIYEILAQEVAERVAEKLIARQKKALVVYTGSTLGFQPALASLEALRQDGFTYRVFLSHSAAELLDVSAIKKALAPEWLMLGETDCPPERLAMPFDTILVPAMTVNAAAHLAVGIADSPAVRMISNSMMRGKNVIAAVDGFCPDNEERAAHGYHLTPGMKAQLRENMEKIRSFGLSLTTAEHLADKTRKVIGAPSAQTETHASVPLVESVASAAAVSAPAAASICEAKVVGRTEVVRCAKNSVLRIRRGALVTQLARDEALGRGIKIQVE